jgi:preprotein translocase subunit SecA
MLRLLLDTLDVEDEPDELREALLTVAQEALASQYQHLAHSVDEQLTRAIERLDDQVEQRVEMAEMAVEGLEIEAEEQGRDVGFDEVIQAIEESVGLKIRFDATEGDEEVDLRKIRRMIPDFIEAGLGVRVWAGLVQAVERRLGQELPMDKSMQMPIDWDQNAEMLQEALQEAWNKQQEQTSLEISRQLDQVFGKMEITEAVLLRLLVQMSYGQRTFFDRKTHQKRSVTVARFTYAYSTAALITDLETDVLLQKILDHLKGAREAMRGFIGLSELNRLSSTRFSDLDEKTLSGVRNNLEEELFNRIIASEEIGALPSEMREPLAHAIGEYHLTEAYRALILSVGDRHWVEYLTQIEALRTSIGLEAYAQRDPLVQYKSRAFDMFQQLLSDVRSGVVSRLFRLQTPSQAASVSSRPKPEQSQAASQKKAAPKKKKRKRRRKRR